MNTPEQKNQPKTNDDQLNTAIEKFYKLNAELRNDIKKLQEAIKGIKEQISTKE